MSIPFFYKEDVEDAHTDVVLDEATSKHVVQVLRMQPGELLKLTNGRGGLFTAAITDNNRKQCVAKVVEKSQILKRQSTISIAISPVKNSNRFEWFLEKATEIGITEIIPLLCRRTEKTAFKFDRMKSILVSAMLQSQQSWLPVLQEPVKFNQLMQAEHNQQKFIAHCIAGTKINLSNLINKSLSSTIILIGPEGDFTAEEIELALAKKFIPVSLGETRLRTETAGIVAATLLSLV